MKQKWPNMGEKKLPPNWLRGKFLSGSSMLTPNIFAKNMYESSITSTTNPLTTIVNLEMMI